MLTISVKNFGPIAEGSVDLKPLTIFVGPSNTGKSYMATAVYAVMRAVEGRPQVPFIRKLERRGIPVSISNPWKASDEMADAVKDWVRQQEGKTWDPDEKLPMSVLPQPIQSALRDSTRQVVELYHDDVIKQLTYGFGDSSNLIKREASRDEFKLLIHRDEPLLNLAVELIEDKRPETWFDISQALTPSNKIEYWGADYQKGIEIFPGLYHDFFFMSRILAAQYVLEEFPQRSFYLPASRSGTVHARRFLASSLIRQSSDPDSTIVNISGLPGMATEFLSDLVSLDRGMGLPKDDLDQSIKFIEKHIMQGEIDLDQSSSLPLPEISYHSSAGKFTLDQTSSMVSELAPLVLFLKYLVRPGDLLILEEPESHLHPAAQRQLARGIVRLVNADVKVLITTHSDIFVSQINNLLRASYASKRWLREHSYAPEDCIQHEDVSAYLFKMDDEVGGSRTERLEIQPDVGIDDPMFNQVIHDLYEETLLVERIRPK